MNNCRVCKKDKEINQFCVNRHIKSGINSMCKSCAIEKLNEYRANNPEQVKISQKKQNQSTAGKERLRRYRVENKDKINAKQRDWYTENRVEILASAKVNLRDLEVKRQYRERNKESINKRISEWQKANPEKGAAKTARYRAAKRQACVSWSNEFFVEEIYSLASLRSKMTGIKWSVDHIVPMQSNLVCGLHCEDNLRVILATENSAKRNHHWPDMPKEISHG